MIKAPHRKATCWSGIGIESFSLSEEQFESIEIKSKIPLLDKDKEVINSAISLQRIILSEERNAPERQDIADELDKSIKALEHLIDILNTKTTETEKNKKAKISARSYLDLNNSTGFDIDNFSGDLSVARSVFKSAYRNLEDEGGIDTGGRAEKDTIIKSLVSHFKNLKTKELGRLLEIINYELPKELKFKQPTNDALKKIRSRK